MTDSYLYFIVALLPLAGVMVVLQDDPYHALVMRGILGAIAAMSYAVLGAADVALTEALVGTMLAITLYAIAVRSSLVMRLGILETGHSETGAAPPSDPRLTPLTQALRPLLKKRHLRLELVPHNSLPSLQRALMDREVHAICAPQPDAEFNPATDTAYPYSILIRVQRLYDILHPELPPNLTRLHYIDISTGNSLNGFATTGTPTDLEEAH